MAVAKVVFPFHRHHEMRTTILLGLGLSTLLQSGNAVADCPLAFAPQHIRDKVRQHYYASSTRDAVPPGDPLVLVVARDRARPASDDPCSPDPVPGQHGDRPGPGSSRRLEPEPLREHTDTTKGVCAGFP